MKFIVCAKSATSGGYICSVQPTSTNGYDLNSRIKQILISFPQVFLPQTPLHV